MGTARRGAAPLLLMVLVFSLSGCANAAEQVSELINKAVPLKEAAFLPIPALVGPMGLIFNILKIILVPIAYGLVAWGLYQWHRHERDLPRFIERYGKGMVLLTLVGAPMLTLVGFHEIAWLLWPDWLDFNFLRQNLGWLIPGLECDLPSPSEAISGLGDAVGGLATIVFAYKVLEFFPRWHALTELLLLMTFPMALTMTLFSRSFKFLAVWVFAWLLWVFSALLWALGATVGGMDAGDAAFSLTGRNVVFAGGTIALEAAVWFAPLLLLILWPDTSSSPREDRSPRRMELPEWAPEAAAVLLAYYFGQQAGESSQSGPNGPGGWPMGPPPRKGLPPPTNGPRGGSGPSSEPIAPGYHRGDGRVVALPPPTRPQRQQPGPASRTLEVGSRPLGAAAGVAAGVVGLPPTTGRSVAQAAQSGPLGTMAERLDEKAAEAGFVLGEERNLPLPTRPSGPASASEALEPERETPLPPTIQPEVGSEGSQPVAAAVVVGETQSSTGLRTGDPYRRGNASQRLHYYASRTIIADGRVIVSKGQIVWYDEVTNQGLMVEDQLIPWEDLE